MSRRRRRPGGPLLGGGAGYSANPVNFDGTNDALARGAGLTDAAASKLYTVSFWLKIAAIGSVQYILRSNSATVIYVSVQTGGEIRFNGEDVAGDLNLNVESNVITDNNWHHVVASFDMSNAANRHVYLDDVSGISVTFYADAAFGFANPTDWFVGANNTVSRFGGDLADLQVWFGQYINLSVEANRRLFIDANGKPVDPAIAAATLGAPIILLSGDTDTWHINDGSGGGFTENGALTDGTGPVEV